MAKTVHNDVLDAALNVIKNSCDKMVACSQMPATFAEANATYALADVAMASGDFTGPADGDVSGRKLTVNAKSSVTVDTEGDPVVIVLLDTANSKILYTTDEGSAQTIYAGNTVNFPAWDIEIADPA
jgi:hypothetical protein